MADVLSWQSRPLEAMYPVVFFDVCGSKSVTTPWLATRLCISGSGYLGRRQARRAGTVDRADRGRQIVYSGERDQGFRRIVIADRGVPKRAITMPEREPSLDPAVALRMTSAVALASSLFCGRRADADTSDELAQIEGSPATEVGLWTDPPAN
jgi:hypothetical protein